MDQLHGAHGNDHAANAPAQTEDLTEHHAAQFNEMKNTTDANGGQGARDPQAPMVTTGPSAMLPRTREGDKEGDSLRTLRRRRR